MAKINFDISKRLDITCRRGDSFKLELTLKDSSGIAINLHGGTAAGFHFHARTQNGSPVFITDNSGFSTGGAFSGEYVTVTLTDTNSSTTADTSDSSYVASTAATGVVKFEASAEDMKFSDFAPGTMNLLYDIQYVDVVTANQVDSKYNEKTILYGNLILKDNASVRTRLS